MKLDNGLCCLVALKGQGNPKISLNNKTLNYQSCQKDLGITMAPRLNWKTNVEKRCSKAVTEFYFLIKRHL